MDTVWPGAYPGRPLHIHAKVTAPGYAPLTTQIYFDTDPLLMAHREYAQVLERVADSCDCEENQEFQRSIMEGLASVSIPMKQMMEEVIV